MSERCRACSRKREEHDNIAHGFMDPLPAPDAPAARDDLRAALAEIAEYEAQIATGDWKADLATCRQMGCMSLEPRIIVTLPDGGQRMAKEQELTALLRIRAVVRRLAARVPVEDSRDE